MPPAPQQLEILDLRHFNARQLRPLLTEQSAVWHRRLRWEYRASTELLLGYLDARILPGYVALYRGKIVGYTFCVYEGHKAVIGDIFAAVGNSSNQAPSPLAVNHTLIRHLLETLLASPDINRIEAQLLLFDAGVLPPAFPRFNVFPRLFLELDLSLSQPAPVVPQEIEALRWSSLFYNDVAELIHQTYAGHIDSDINDQYRTLAGSMRFLHNVIRFPGCGTFDPDSSFVLRERSATPGLPIGVILVSRVAPDTAHITQLAVAPTHRGRGLGRELFHLCLRHLPTRNYRALTLPVTEANTPAVRLYATAGFRTRHRFDALVLDK